MTTYEPGQPVWAYLGGEWKYGTVSTHFSKYWRVIDLPDGRDRIVHVCKLRPRDPALEGKDKPNE